MEATAIEAGFENPCALAFDDAGNLYIADFVSNRIRRIRAQKTALSKPLLEMANPTSCVSML